MPLFRTLLGGGSLVVGLICWCAWAAPADSPKPAANADLEKDFTTKVQPFLRQYCFSCHGAKKQEASLDLSRDATVSAIAKNAKQWETVLDRLHAKEMPPEDARQPEAGERTAVIAWIRQLRDREAERTAGDPGIVLARRLSNAEYDYTIRDLTGVDIRPTREFPVDPANEAGFDNTGESLTMSAALLKKYLAAARLVADHVVLKPEGFVFAPHPVVTDTDRDKYCVGRIVDFYQRHRVNYEEYFLAAWKYRRDKLLKQDADLKRHAAALGLSPRYLETVWSLLTEGEATGPLAALRKLWNEMPATDRDSAELAKSCVQMREEVLRLRKEYAPKVEKLSAKGISQGSQSFILWRNDQLARQHMRYTGDPKAPNADSIAKFCKTFPDTFVVIERGPFYDPSASPKGRFLSAGFHLMQGFYRDDAPLYELVLDDAGRREIDTLWTELHFVTQDAIRQYKDFIFFERAEPPRFMFDATFDFARSEDKDSASDAKIKQLRKVYLTKARNNGASAVALEAIETYFTTINKQIRDIEEARKAAEPSHLAAMQAFAARAYRRPLSPAEREHLLKFYRQSREKDQLSHEDAIRDTLVTVLMSPHFCYRYDRAPVAAAADSPRTQPLTDYELASRLSYFLWSSMPDAELLKHAEAHDLHKPDVLTAQARRMLRDPRVRGLATEFAGNWLDIRRFEEHNSVDRERFPSFTNELRQAMFEEPVRYFIDIAQRNRSVLDMLYGKDTFVNPTLAQHYGMPGEPGASATGVRSDNWFHVEDATPSGRGGLLPMAVFLTKNAPGLRTSPVKRGYWVVRRLLGEQIPPPPPTVPELPKDESKLGELTLPQVLAKHRDNKACAGCHRRFDSVGVVFEDYGPIGELRTKDLGGKPTQTSATFPDGKERAKLAGLRDYLREERERDFVDNLCKKLLSYGLGRSLQLSDKKTLDAMRTRLTADKYAFGSLVEVIVTSPQFLNKRARD